MKLITNINNFGFEIMKILNKSNIENNICFCPLSAYFIMSLLEMGAKGKTFDELKIILGEDFSVLLENNDSNFIKTLKKDLNQFFEDIEISAKCNTKVFHQFEILPNFKKNANDVFKMVTEKLNFKDCLLAMNTMNKWVSEKTDGNIKELFKKPLETDTNFVMINTLLFESKWEDHFDSSNTMLETFYISEKKTCKVQMMNKSAFCRYLKDKDTLTSLIVLPFKIKKIVAIFILPNEGSNLDNVFNNLEARDFHSLYAKSKNDVVEVSIPKLNLSNLVPLKDCLNSMGVKDLFTSHVSDLSHISHTQSSINDIYQCVNIKIDEEGVVAAAATVCECCVDGVTDFETTIFKLDRPFLFLIYDTSTQLVLFSNVVTDPSKSLNAT
uniref:Serpin 5 n=1 Tax=Myxobolus cerebralis TaxID=59783 RepID=A0A7M3V7B5_9CNID|nr:serpin 5 [Myxobolus cerebralis]